jgi:hypothetical protein
MQLLQRMGLALAVLSFLLFTRCKKEMSCEQCTDNIPIAGNHPPVANAGTDVVVVWPADSATLNGSASADPDNNIKAYRWQKIEGPSAGRLSGPDAATTRVTKLVEGQYAFELTVTDAGGLASKDSVQVTVIETGRSVVGNVPESD